MCAGAQLIVDYAPPGTQRGKRFDLGAHVGVDAGAQWRPVTWMDGRDDALYAGRFNA